VAFQSPFCSFCRAPLTWGDTLEIKPGRAVASLDLRAHAMPGEKSLTRSMQATPEGRLLTIDGTGAFSGTFTTPMRDACVSISGIAYDANIGFGVSGRVLKAGAASSAYAVMVHPGFRAYRVHRVLWTKTETFVEAIRDWEAVPAVAGVGALNHVELRYADAVFQVVINGAHVASLVDARFGYGCAGWRATSYGELPQRKRVLFRSLEVRTVA
jgi:hypothetical protein